MKKRMFYFLLCLLLLAGAFGLTASAADPGTSSHRLEEYAHKRIGILTGSIHDATVSAYLPDAQQLYFSLVSDEVTALGCGTVDAFSCDILTARALMAENSAFTYIDDAMAYMPTAFAFDQGDRGGELCAQMDEFLQKLEADGTLGELQDKWLSIGAGDYDTDLSGLDGEKTLVFATSCSGKPNAYYYNNTPTGYEVELAAMFCREYGYGLDIQVTDFAGIIPGLVSGKYDFAADGIAVTEERAQSVNFSVPDFNSAIVLVVKADEPTASQTNYTVPSQLDRPDVSLGIVTGMVLEPFYESVTPQAELLYYNTLSDMIYALSIGQIEGFLYDEPMALYLEAHNEGLQCLDEVVMPVYDYGFVFGESDFDQKLQVEFNEYLAQSKADGTLEALRELWFGEDEENAAVDFPTEGPNGVVKVATNSDNPPIDYVKDGELAGMEMDILARFCTQYGYALEADDMDFSAGLTAVGSGRYDVAAAYLAMTPERMEAVRFSDSYTSAGVRMLVRKTVEKDSFWTRLAASFERTFIREDRWKLIVEGIGTTMLISLGASVLGTVLGFGLCLLRRLKSRVIHGITTVYIRILQGTPLLVLLMILYYVVFGKSGMDGKLVAIIAFALNFAAYVCEMFRSGIEAVDIGQTEAAYAIGFTKSQTFFRIVLPQAAVNFLPVYKGEFISLVKMTSIIGYIAVQDLTKMSDIIRSRTYEAFFPLIATAVIYFLLASLLTGLLKSVELKVRPNRENRTLKGVKLP